MAPRDKYNDISYWPEGFGNLDNAGRLRMYKMGQFIRKRYATFLTDDFREVYSRSSDVDRCIESSQAVIAGMYPPPTRSNWNAKIPWTPAPVHTVPAPDDYLLNEAGRKYLDIVVQEIEKLQSADKTKKLYEESVNERVILEKEYGYDYDSFVKFKCTYSTLDIEYRNGLEMPSWYNEEMREKLYKWAGLAFSLAAGGTEVLKKTRNQHLLADLVKRLEICSAGPKHIPKSEYHQPTNAPGSVEDRKVVHYSTHDSIMAAFLEALNINGNSPVPPGFGATFFIEVHATDLKLGNKSDKYLKLYYLDKTETEEPIEMILPNCELDKDGRLSVANFKEYVRHLLPDEN